LGFYLRKLRRIVLHTIIHADDTPHKIALGVGVATLIAFLPLVGFQTAIAIGIAALIRANKAVCVPIVWITNPFTFVPIYGASLALGRFVLASPVSVPDTEILSTLERGHAAATTWDLQFWKSLFFELVGLGAELWVGCAIIGLLAAIGAYGISRWGVSGYRERRRRKILRRSLYRSNMSAGKVVRRSEPA